MIQAGIFGCAGLRLTAEERAFFRDTDPLGFILFARNLEAPDQVRALTAEMRACLGRAAPILIDQEGGRVARLKAPHWRHPPPARRFGELAERDPESAKRAVFLNHRLIAADLADLGIDVDCAPLVDLFFADAHAVIGDRAYGGDPDLVAELGRAAAEGLLAGGVTPIVKHIPGHGRANLDSHLALPRVATRREILAMSDFRPFRLLNDMPWAMTAHIVYEAIDPELPATLSPRLIRDVLRGEIGFSGLLVSDDVSMRALSGDLTDLTRRILAAPCDLVLHCNGDLGEMRQVAAGLAPLTDAAARRYAAGLARKTAAGAPLPGSYAELHRELTARLGA